MKISEFLFILTTCIYFSISVNAQMFEEVLTETTSIKQALSTNVDILECSQNIEYANQKVKESKALYYPDLEFNINFSHFKNMTPSIISNNISQTPIFLPIDKKDLYYASKISICENIYLGGRIKTTNRLTKINKEKTENEKEIVKNKVINNIKLIFNECLYHKELLEFYLTKMNAYNLRRIHLSPSQIRKLKKQCLEEQLFYNKEVLNLLATIGKDLNSIIKISGHITPKIKYLNLNTCLFLSHQFKPEIKSSQYQENLDSLTLNLLSLQKFPVITVGAVHEWVGEKLSSKKDNKTNWYLSLNANFPIFDGGSLFARIKQGKIKLRQSTLAKTKAERDIELFVIKTFLEYDFWRSRALEAKLLEKNKRYNDEELEIIRDLNKSYYNLEFAVGVDLDSY
jgi:outer membrane protein TolC